MERAILALAFTGLCLARHNNALCALLSNNTFASRNIEHVCAGAEMDALDGMDLAARSSMEAKEYWVHLDVDGSLEKYPGLYEHQLDLHLLIR